MFRAVRCPIPMIPLFLAAVLVVDGFAEKTLYVSPTGDDNAAGTEQAPFKTLLKARDKVREINDGSEDIVVYLRGNDNGGYHFPDATLELDQRDGGSNGATVTWRAYPGETPIISGGMRITDWTLHDQEKNIWKASTPVTKKIRSMTVDYLPAVRALGKKFKQGEEWGTYADGSEGFYVGAVASRWGKELEPYSVDLHNPADAEIYKWDTWLSQRWCVEDQLSAGENAKIKMQQPMWRIAQYKAGRHKEGAELLFENDLSFLDFKNEFYYDRPAQTLYYIPRKEVDMESAVVMVPRIERLITVMGASPDEQVTNLTFEGIAFHDDSYLLTKVEDSYGYVGTQGPTAFIRPVQGENWQDGLVEYWMGQSVVQSAIEVLFADNITIRNCRFEYCGGGGVNFMNDVHNSTVDGCIFRWMGSHAVIVGHDEHCDPNECYDQEGYPFPADPSYIETCTDITIANNITRNVSWNLTHVPSIMVYFTNGFKLLHNDLGPCGFNTVSFGWAWGRCDDTKEHFNNYAAHNVVHTGCKHHGDCGTFYTLGDQHDFVAEENFFPNEWGPYDLTSKPTNMTFQQDSDPDSYLWYGSTSGAVKGYYPDASTKNITYLNTVYEGNSRIASSWTGDETVVLDGGWRSSNSKESPCDKYTCKDIVVYEPGNRPSEAQAVIDKAGPENKSLYDGLDWRPGEPNPVRITERSARRSPRDGAVTASLTRGPNPELHVRVPRGQTLSVTLHDMAGRACLRLFDGAAEQGTHRLSLAPDGPVRSIGNGSYLITVRGERGGAILPVIIMQ